MTSTAQAQSLPPALNPDDFISAPTDQVVLGQKLFFDKILSGNRNISCATCHHPKLGSGDGLSLGIGEGGDGLGTFRTAGHGDERILERIPRNAPALWNLGHKDVSVLFHDGRLSRSDLYGNAFQTPAEEYLPHGLNSPLAAQAMFPVTSRAEMAGNVRENEIAGAVNDRIDQAWPIIAKRVAAIPEYEAMFIKAFDHIKRGADITMVDIANAMAAFMSKEFACYDTPFDAFLRGDATKMKPEQLRGMSLFYGSAQCATCHSGPLMSDQSFHALALPAFGPGRTQKFDLIARDLGRMDESQRIEDAYRFRTPMLRNVALTAPYGHNGAYASLRDMVQHHFDPVQMRAAWTPDKAILPDVPWLNHEDFLVQQDRLEMERQARALDIDLPKLSPRDIDDIVAFLHALTEKPGPDKLGVPATVPSGLPVDQ